MRKLLIGLGIFIFISSCTKEGSKAQVQYGNAEITKVLERFYKSYGHSGETLYEQPIAGDLFTPQIQAEIEEIVKLSKDDIERVKRSAHPDEKPLLIEGSLFSSLYEGYTQYHIRSVDTRNMKPQVKTADATVELENTSVSPKIVWTDKVHLIHSSGKGWQIDNITFDKIAPVKDLKTRLNNFRAEFKR